MPCYKNYNEDRTKKVCAICREMKPIEVFRMQSTQNPKKGPYRNLICRPCESRSVEYYRKTDPLGVASGFVRRARWISNNAGLRFDLDKWWVRDQLETQQWKCALSGLPMIPSKPGEKGRGFSWQSPSMDCIRHKEGYTKDNVRFVINAINLLRNDGPDERVYLIAEALVNFRQAKNRQ